VAAREELIGEIEHRISGAQQGIAANYFPSRAGAKSCRLDLEPFSVS
jgi:hypothetical protein